MPKTYYIVKKYNKNYNNKTVSEQNKLQNKNHYRNKNQLELECKFLNDSTLAASETFDGKLFHNTVATLIKENPLAKISKHSGDKKTIEITDDMTCHIL